MDSPYNGIVKQWNLQTMESLHNGKFKQWIFTQWNIQTMDLQTIIQHNDLKINMQYDILMNWLDVQKNPSEKYKMAAIWTICEFLMFWPWAAIQHKIQSFEGNLCLIRSQLFFKSIFLVCIILVVPYWEFCGAENSRCQEELVDFGLTSNIWLYQATW